MSRKRQHLLIAVLVFIAEILIATTFAHTGFIRPFLGDYLVVILLYHLFKSFRDIAPLKLAIGVFVFACLVETAQFFQLADVLGFARGSVMSIIIGTSFSWTDIVMYWLGCVTAYGFDRFLLSTAPSTKHKN